MTTDEETTRPPGSGLTASPPSVSQRDEAARAAASADASRAGPLGWAAGRPWAPGAASSLPHRDARRT